MTHQDISDLAILAWGFVAFGALIVYICKMMVGF